MLLETNNHRPVVERRLSAVRTIELGKRIDGRLILEEISLDISAGQFVVVFGANGAGKSTLLKVMATLLPATSGELHLFGQSARRPDPRLRARIGMIDHQPMLYRELTVLENLVFFARLYGVPKPARRAGEMLARVGLSDRAGDCVKTLSRGMLQRVSIARALLHAPDLLLADEPFTGLDVASATMFEELLRELHAAGKTIVMVHHDIAHGLRLAEHAIVLRAGRMVIDRPTRLLDLPTALKEVCPA
ncbi:MAG: ABC transporter ATP-binding protein [Phycisphaerae bacterium]|nr:ABC transporter ATP-binding protein [Phycisphaerae bacterium]